jgi:hypothetical protein
MVAPTLDGMCPEGLSEPADVGRDAVVIRFWPVNPDTVWKRACQEHKLTEHYRLSVFADRRRSHETQQDVIYRLLKASEVGINPAKNKKFTLCTSAAELLDLGFTFWKDGDDDNEPDEHYSVDLGADATLEDVIRFLGAFRTEMRR